MRDILILINLINDILMRELLYVQLLYQQTAALLAQFNQGEKDEVLDKVCCLVAILRHYFFEDAGEVV